MADSRPAPPDFDRGPGKALAAVSYQSPFRVVMGEAEAHPFDALEAWIRRSPSERSVWTLDCTAGKWRVGLTTSSERLSAGVGETLAAAARAALAIADAAGYL